MNEENKNAFPTGMAVGDIGKIEGGLTKREYFAAMALVGFCSWNHNERRMICDHTSRAEEAILVADDLLQRLKSKN